MSKSIKLWIALTCLALPVSICIGLLFVIGQDEAGAAMGFPMGLLGGMTVFGLPVTFRLLYLLRNNTFGLSSAQKVTYRIAITINIVLSLIVPLLLLVEGGALISIIAILVIYVGVFGFNRPRFL